MNAMVKNHDLIKKNICMQPYCRNDLKDKTTKERWLGLTREKVFQNYRLIIKNDTMPDENCIVQFGQYDYLPRLNLLLTYKHYRCVSVMSFIIEMKP